MIARILTALILAPIVVWLTLSLSTPWFSAVVLAGLLFGLFEWNRLTVKSPLLFSVAAIVLAIVTWWLGAHPKMLLALCVLASVFWMMQIVSLRQFVLCDAIAGNMSAAFIQGLFCLLGGWAGLILLHQQAGNGPMVTVALLFVVWAADSGAYFAGKAFGQNQLASNISPNKTLEGVAGGLIGAGVFAGLFGYFALKLAFDAVWLWIAAGIVAAVFSVTGDLYESRVKRIAGVKNSGSLLPGHGGVLDRIDGLIAAAPVFAALWHLILWYQPQ